MTLVLSFSPKRQQYVDIFNAFVEFVKSKFEIETRKVTKKFGAMHICFTEQLE